MQLEKSCNPQPEIVSIQPHIYIVIWDVPILQNRMPILQNRMLWSIYVINNLF
jgi:hypothetical protein